MTVEPPSDAPAEPAARPISDAGLDLGGEELTTAESGSLAGIEKNTPDATDSGRDLIAEAVESGVHGPAEAFDVASLPSVEPGADAVDEIVVGESGTALAAGRLASEAEEVDLTEISGPEVDSSAVDLGASATFPAAPSEAPPEPAEFEPGRRPDAKPKSIHGEEGATASEVNLGGRRDETGSGIAGDYFDEATDLGGSAIHVADDEPAAVEEEELEPAAEEEPVEEAAEEEQAPPKKKGKPKPEKRASTAGAWMAGTFLGGLAATGVCLGLWLFSIEPPKEWRAMAGSLTGAPTPPLTKSGPGPGATPPPLTLADKIALIESGDLAKAKQADVEQVDETKSEQLAARGEYRVRSYLQQQSAIKAPLKPDDPALQAGMKDLETAAKDNADAQFWLAVTLEATNNLPAAEKAYKDGVDRFGKDAVQKERFEAGLDRVTAREAGRPAGMGRATPAGAWLALLLTGLEPPAADPATKDAAPAPKEPPAPAGAAAPVEAGSAFWRAARLAHDQQYSDAVKELEEAEDLHAKRRFTVLGKAQNPNSDPTEEIFLRSCEELKAYWQLEDKLRTAGYLDAAKGKDAAKAVDDLLAQNKALGGKLAKAAADAEAAQKRPGGGQKGAGRRQKRDGND